MPGTVSFNGQDAIPGQKSFRWLKVTTRLDGSDLNIPIHVVSGTREGPVLGLFSTLHGGEWLSIEMLRRVTEALDPTTMAGSVIVVPVANPAAFGQLTRMTPDESDAPDLNRVFPGDYTWTSTLLARKLTDEILPQTDALMDFHLGLWGASFGTIVYGRDFTDSSVSERSLSMARAFGHPYIEREQLVSRFPGPGSMLGYAGEVMGIPSVISEIGGAGFSPGLEESWIETNVRGMFGVMRQLGILDGPPPCLDRYLMIEKTHRVNPSVGGYLHPELGEDRLMSEVREGDLLGRVISPHTFEELERLTAPVDGRLYLISRPYPVNPGDWAFGVVDSAYATWES